MDFSIFGGVAWGLTAAAVHYFHIERSTRRVGAEEKPLGRIAKTLASSFYRFCALLVFFLVAAFWEAIRLDASVLSFALAHLVLMVCLGVKLKGGNIGS